MITDVFAADPQALPEYRKAGFPNPADHGFATVTARGLDPVALAILDTLLSGAPWDQALADATMTPGGEPDLYTGPVVTALSPRIARLLPAVGPDQLIALAHDWGGNPELADRAPASLLDWLTHTQSLCRDAAVHGHLVLVWNCL